MVVSRTHVFVIWSLLALGIVYVAAGLVAQEVPARNAVREADTTVVGDGAKFPQFDPELVAKGKAAFEAKCTTCHDADRTLCKKKQPVAYDLMGSLTERPHNGKNGLPRATRRAMCKA